MYVTSGVYVCLKVLTNKLLVLCVSNIKWTTATGTILLVRRLWYWYLVRGFEIDTTDLFKGKDTRPQYLSNLFLILMSSVYATATFCKVILLFVEILIAGIFVNLLCHLPSKENLFCFTNMKHFTLHTIRAPTPLLHFTVFWDRFICAVMCGSNETFYASIFMTPTKAELSLLPHSKPALAY